MQQAIARALRAGSACITISTSEEHLALEALRTCASERNLRAWFWSCTRGLRRGHWESREETKANAEATDAGVAIVTAYEQVNEPAMVVLCDVAAHLEPSAPGGVRAQRALRELITLFADGGTTQQLRGKLFVVLLEGPGSKLPASIEETWHRCDVPPPDDEAITDIIKDTARRIAAQAVVGTGSPRPVIAKISKSSLSRMVEQLRGLTQSQIERAIANVIHQDNALTDEDLPRLIEVKRSMVASGGVLEFVSRPKSLDEVGGLQTLKAWLKKREASFTSAGREAGLPAPRGVLLLGVQGSGKSLCAKAIATAWQRPLLKLDPGVLYDKYLGESERRLRDALRQAEVMSPVVLWIDEIEKGFASAASQSTDGGLSKRMFGTLLNWMQEHTAPVFLVATANDVSALPPELMRKGRFDEIFFVDLPGSAAREQILRIHLSKRGVHVPPFEAPTLRVRDDASQTKLTVAELSTNSVFSSDDLAMLVSASESRSGAEIEQAIIDAQYASFDAKLPLRASDVAASLEASPPIAVTMRERIADLRAWAAGRCVPAE
jgi:ATP-dependent 26S proteasome regulatory subunit